MSKAPSQISMIPGLAKYIFLSLIKNKASFFFGLVFPIIIVSVFGSIGGGTAKTKVGIDDALSANNPVVVSLQKIADQDDAPIEITHGNISDLRTTLNKNDLDGVLENSDEKTVKLLTSNTNQVGSGTVKAFINTIVGQASLAAAHAQPVVIIQNEEVSGKTLKSIDFILPGQIGFSILATAIFGVGFTFLSLRKTLVLKRIFSTTVKPITFVIAQSLARSVQGVLQAVILIGFGALAFHFQLINGFTTLAEIALLSALGVLTFIGFGIFLSNIAPDEQTLPVVLNLFNLPQMFLSGIFFPTSLMPDWLQTIGNNLPLAYVATAMRKITIDNVPFYQLWPYLLGMAVWAIISYILAARTFKAE